MCVSMEPADPGDQSCTREVIDGWEFDLECLAFSACGGAPGHQPVELLVRVRTQCGVKAAALEHGRRACFLAARRIFGLLKAEPFDLNVYLLRSAAECRRAAIELGRSSGLGPTCRGVSIATGPRPGTFHDAGQFWCLLAALRTIAHEIGHQVIRSLAPKRRIPTWFNEGCAEALAMAIAAESDPAYGDKIRFVREAKAVGAARVATLPLLVPLRSGARWGAALVSTAGHVGELAHLAVEFLVRGHAAGLGSLRQVLQRMAGRESFGESFETVFGQTPPMFEQEFRGHVGGPLSAQYPPGLNAQVRAVHGIGERLSFAWLGVPSEAVHRQYHDPTGKDSFSPKFGTADSCGFLCFDFRRRSIHAAGTWVVTAEGGTGSRSSLEFEVIDSRSV